jgi:UDP-GlcNAc:undecaprenyl-phosphate GlcNAc-1-phosphate transferase
MALTGNKLVGLYGLFGIDTFPEWLSYIVTAFTIIVITNSFNLIDGLDGLTGTIAVISLSFLGVWFVLINQMSLAIFNFSMLGAVIAFLIYNWEPSKIFMGDTGALFPGFFFCGNGYLFY